MSPTTNSPDFSIRSQSSSGHRLIKNSTLLGASRILSGILGVFTLIIANNALGDIGAFGLLLFTHAYMLFFSEVGSLHFSHSVVKYGADYAANSEIDKFGRLILTGLLLDALATVTAFLAAILSLGLFLQIYGFVSTDTAIAGHSQSELFVLIAVYCTVILFRQTSTSLGVVRFFDRFDLLSIRTLVLPLTRFFGALYAAQAGWGLIGFLGIWYGASLLSYLTLMVIAISVLWSRGFLPIIMESRIYSAKELPELYRFVGRTFLDSTLHAFKQYFPSVLVMGAFGPAIVAVFRIAEEIANVLAKAIILFDQTFFPELARQSVNMTSEQAYNFTRKAALGIGSFGIVVAALVFFAGDPLVRMGFGAGYEQSAEIAAFLIIGSTIIGLCIPFYSLFYTKSKPQWAILSRLSGVFTYVLVFSAAAPITGVFVVAWASVLGGAVQWTATRSFVRKLRA